jgi:hypothetical protein
VVAMEVVKNTYKFQNVTLMGTNLNKKIWRVNSADVLQAWHQGES